MIYILPALKLTSMELAARSIMAAVRLAQELPQDVPNRIQKHNAIEEKQTSSQAPSEQPARRQQASFSWNISQMAACQKAILLALHEKASTTGLSSQNCGFQQKLLQPF